MPRYSFYMIEIIGTVVAAIGAGILGDRIGDRLYDWWHIG